VARQLRLRDLAGLVVIDFIDMDESRNARNVERRIKDKLKSDRARIQVGRISPFGLLEMSRQRLRPSLQEASTEVCNHCEGTGVVRSIESSALHLLRAIEEEGIRGRAAEINVHAATAVAIYLLNQKRSSVLTLEERFNMDISVAADESLVPPDFRMERLHSRSDDEMEAIASDVVSMVAYDDPEDDVEEEVTETRDEESDEGAAKKRRRRGKRGGRRRRGANEEETSTEENSNGDAAEAKPSESKASEEASSTENTPENTEEGEKEDKPRRRRRRPRRRRGAANNNAEPGAEATAEASTETAEGSTAVATENAEPVVAEVASEKAPEVETAEPVAAEPVAVEPFVEETVAPIAAVETTPVEVSEPEPAAAVVEPVNTDPVTVSAGGAEEKEEAKPRKRGWWRRD
ncbi:MAG: ribonuclease E/G, partial [Alphaproteobacteria bacterium]|nr:ribonuclease E/G [Alphaproteobacteria bacterium]